MASFQRVQIPIDEFADPSLRRAYRPGLLDKIAQESHAREAMNWRAQLLALPRYFWPAVCPSMEAREPRLQRIREHASVTDKLNAYRVFCGVSRA